VLALLGSFFALSVIYLLMGFPFMASVQIVVYAGAILVLFLFVIMLLDLGAMSRQVVLPASAVRSRAGQIGSALALGLLLVGLIAAQSAALRPIVGAREPTQALDALPKLSGALFGRYGLAFQATGLLLLVTMVAVVALAKRQRKSRFSTRADATRGGA
jgi:NADH-quinone oxidoreductase subunit J